MKRILQIALAYMSRDPERDREIAYLNESVSVTDLERRMREVDAGQFRSRL